jgi:hypothetical protein
MPICFFCHQALNPSTTAMSSEIRSSSVIVSQDFQKVYQLLPLHYRKLFYVPRTPDQNEIENEAQQEINQLPAPSTDEGLEIVAHSACYSCAIWCVNQYENDKQSLARLELL